MLEMSMKEPSAGERDGAPLAWIGRQRAYPDAARLRARPSPAPALIFVACNLPAWPTRAASETASLTRLRGPARCGASPCHETSGISITKSFHKWYFTFH